LSRTPRDINADTLRKMIADCTKFEEQAREIIAAADATGKCKREGSAGVWQKSRCKRG
jgi:hypothetical protein